jgi:hypothetical protein
MIGLRTHHVREGDPGRYATADDFCRVFSEEIDGLYQLSFLVTGNHDKAESCVLAALEECSRSTQVFREWAISWAKCAIIRHAVRELRPRLHRDTAVESEPVLRSSARLADFRDNYFKAEAVLALEDFERLVFVISVLERYSTRDCAALLCCSLLEVRQGRTQASVHIGQQCFAGRSTDATVFISERSASLITLTEVPPDGRPTF